MSNAGSCSSPPFTMHGTVIHSGIWSVWHSHLVRLKFGTLGRGERDPASCRHGLLFFFFLGLPFSLTIIAVPVRMTRALTSRAFFVCVCARWRRGFDEHHASSSLSSSVSSFLTTFAFVIQLRVRDGGAFAGFGEQGVQLFRVVPWIAFTAL